MQKLWQFHENNEYYAYDISMQPVTFNPHMERKFLSNVVWYICIQLNVEENLTVLTLTFAQISVSPEVLTYWNPFSA